LLQQFNYGQGEIVQSTSLIENKERQAILKEREEEISSQEIIGALQRQQNPEQDEA
jgi:hypothetical protein